MAPPSSFVENLVTQRFIALVTEAIAQLFSDRGNGFHSLMVPFRENMGDYHDYTFSEETGKVRIMTCYLPISCF